MTHRPCDQHETSPGNIANRCGVTRWVADRVKSIMPSIFIAEDWDDLAANLSLMEYLESSEDFPCPE